MTDTRPLSPAEVTLAKHVYLDTLPYDRIEIGAGLTSGDRAPTSRGDPSLWKLRYTLHIGPDAYVYGMDSTPELQVRLIHELAHVWQGYHEDHLATAILGNPMIVGSGFFAAGEVTHLFELFGVDPHDEHGPAFRWPLYGMEAQARLVSGWFERGEDVNDPDFHYVREVIRRPAG